MMGGSGLSEDRLVPSPAFRCPMLFSASWWFVIGMLLHTASTLLVPPAFVQERDDAPATFINPIAEGADPWVIANPLAKTAGKDQPAHYGHNFYWCLSDANRSIAIYTGDRLTGLGKKHVVWRAPRRGPYSREIWAPELHYLQGHWYVYVAASDGDNANHLAYVLKSETDDVLGPYEVHGPLATGDGADGKTPNVWAIDMTVLQHKGKLYAIWSGWDAPGTDQQYLYIAPMASPTELAGPRVLLCDNDDYLWERLEPSEEHRGLNEGPEVFQANGRTFLFYSCGASWLPTYKLGRLELVGEDPLDPASWKKSSTPAFVSSDSVYGVGHSCFVPSPDGQQWWHVFHAKRDRQPGWRRAIYVQPMSLDADGVPQLGQPQAPNQPLPLPSGEPAVGKDVPKSLQDGGEWKPMQEGAAYDYYGHHQRETIADAGTDTATFRIGLRPNEPINDYSSGEKVVFADRIPAEFAAQVSIDFQGVSEARDAGLLFACQQPSVGYDAEQAYFAGVIPSAGRVILGEMDGQHWKELARADVQVDVDQPVKLQVEVSADGIKISCNGQLVITYQEADLPSGRLGVRVVDTDAVFRDLVVRGR